MLRAYLFLALLEPKTPPKQQVERRAQKQIYSNRAPDYCLFVSGRKILSRNKYTVIGIPITVYLFLDSTAAISQNQSRKEVERSAQKQIYSNRAPDYCLFVSGQVRSRALARGSQGTS